MVEATVGRWGKSLAVRVPQSVAAEAGLADGQKVEFTVKDGDIVIHRAGVSPEARARAMEAVEWIKANRSRFKLDGLTIRDLIDEGRR